MKNSHVKILIFILLLGFGSLYYYIDFGGQNTDKVFITITTFFFSIFTGFFITRQGNRYTKIREILGTFDGKMSGIYRAAGNVSLKIQQDSGAIIKDHYQKILETKMWNYHFVNKSSTITQLHNVLETEVGNNKQESLRNQAVGRMMANLGDAQVLRKNMVMLYQERIPLFQWVLIFLFTFILISTITVIPSAGFFLGSILKASFAVSVISVVIILYNLDNLHLFEEFIGENSAKDVVHIIEGVK